MSKEEGCGCGHNHANPQVEEIVYNNHFVLNTLIGLLIDKGVFSKEELEAKAKAIQEEQLKMHQAAMEEAQNQEGASEDAPNAEELAKELNGEK